MVIESLEDLRSLYAQPSDRALGKQIDHLDAHCRAFVALSPFVVMSTSSADGRLDASPRGGEPGFVKVDGEGRLLIPDASGNNRLDTYGNILATKRVGLLLLVPGFDETLRVNGTACLSTDAIDLQACAASAGQPPAKLVVRVGVEEAYFHCGKSFMRSRLWEPDARTDRSLLPPLGQMIADQISQRDEQQASRN